MRRRRTGKVLQRGTSWRRSRGRSCWTPPPPPLWSSPRTRWRLAAMRTSPTRSSVSWSRRTSWSTARSRALTSSCATSAHDSSERRTCCGTTLKQNTSDATTADRCNLRSGDQCRASRREDWSLEKSTPPALRDWRQRSCKRWPSLVRAILSWGRRASCRRAQLLTSAPSMWLVWKEKVAAVRARLEP